MSRSESHQVEPGATGPCADFGFVKQGLPRTRSFDLVMASGILTRGSPPPPRAGMSTLRHHCSLPSRDAWSKASVLIQTSRGLCNLHCFWMSPDMVPARSVRHRFVIYKKSCKSFHRNHKASNKDKGTWICKYKVVLFVINTGETVYERN